jgi:hypothetical protein
MVRCGTDELEQLPGSGVGGTQRGAELVTRDVPTGVTPVLCRRPAGAGDQLLIEDLVLTELGRHRLRLDCVGDDRGDRPRAVRSRHGQWDHCGRASRRRQALLFFDGADAGGEFDQADGGDHDQAVDGDGQ